MSGSDASATRRFEHDGHAFEVEERRVTAPPGTQQAEPWLHWSVRLDGRQVLEFEGPYPYRDEHVQMRIIEWYETQNSR